MTAHLEYARIFRRVTRSQDAILQYSRASGSTYPWLWPLDEHGARLNPADFNQYRKSHQFRGPFCLCSLKFEDQAEDVEAAIYVAKSGICLGEYVLSCARNNCGYFIFLERMQHNPKLPSKTYEKRAPGEYVPPSVCHASFTSPCVIDTCPSDIPTSRSMRPLKRSYRLSDLEDGLSLSEQRPLKRTYASLDVLVATAEPATTTVLEDLMKLDSLHKPGLSEVQFGQLITKLGRCSRCGMILARRRTMLHRQNCVARFRG